MKRIQGCFPTFSVGRIAVICSCMTDHYGYFQGILRIIPGGIKSGRVAKGSHDPFRRSEEHTSELQSLMRISYAVFCLNKKKINTKKTHSITTQIQIITQHKQNQ